MGLSIFQSRMEGIRGGEATVDLRSLQRGSVKVAVPGSLRNARELIQRVKSGKADYQFIRSDGLPGRRMSMAAAARIQEIRTSLRRGARRPTISDRPAPVYRQSHGESGVIRLYDGSQETERQELASPTSHVLYGPGQRLRIHRDLISQIWKTVKLG